jgi:hypothetical protein
MLEKVLINLLPYIILVESFLAGMILLYYQRYGSAMYWLSAGFLNLAVIVFIKKFG